MRVSIINTRLKFPRGDVWINCQWDEPARSPVYQCGLLIREQAGPPGTYSHLLTDIQKEAPLFCHNFSSFCVYDMGYEHLDGKIMCFSFLCWTLNIAGKVKVYWKMYIFMVWYLRSCQSSGNIVNSKFCVINGCTYVSSAPRLLISLKVQNCAKRRPASLSSGPWTIRQTAGN